MKTKGAHKKNQITVQINSFSKDIHQKYKSTHTALFHFTHMSYGPLKMHSKIFIKELFILQELQKNETCILYGKYSIFSNTEHTFATYS